MRILFVVSNLSYPPLEGLHQHSLLLVKSLAQSGDDVEIMGFVKDIESVDLTHLADYLAIDHVGPFVEYRGPSLGLALRNMLPLWMIQGQGRRIRSHIKAARADVIHLDGVAAASLFRSDVTAATVLSFVDPGSQRQLRFARASGARPKALPHLLASLLYFAVERRLNFPQLTWHVVSESDREYLQRVHHHAHVAAIPLMVPRDLSAGEENSARSAHDARILVLIWGDLRRSDMRQALLDLFATSMPKSILAPTCTFLVLGRVQADAELSEVSQAYDCEFIQWTDDYVDLISSCDIVILPDIVGTGIKTRAIQSLALGKPIIGTAVAFEGIDVPSSDVARVAKSSLEIALHLDELCASFKLRKQIGANARAFAESRYSQAIIVHRWQEVYEDAVNLYRSNLHMPAD